MRLTLHFILLCFALTLTVSCTKPDHSEEVKELQKELQAELFTTPEHALLRVDSAEQVGLVSKEAANFLRATLYSQM